MNEVIDTYTASLQSDQEQVTNCVKCAADWLRIKEVLQEDIGNSEIVLAEAMNNIIEHAYEYELGQPIDLEISLDANFVSITIHDSGHEMNEVPRKKVMQGNDVAFDDLPEGGFGWFLIHTLTQKIAYQRIRTQNQLILEIPFV